MHSALAQSTSRRSEFRPDIQGLRAIAVILVVLYHAGLPGLQGGYIGVDIFFAISGFLITAHLIRGLTQNSFSLSSFYARRIRRLLPAAALVLGLSVAAAWIVVPPLELARVGRDAIWTALYIPNILFAREGTNYLATPEPSLFQHFWSLGVEEQFYLIWPLLLVLTFIAGRRSVRVLGWTMIVLTVLSLAAAIIGTSVDQPGAFFLLPYRAWEFGLGGIVAWLAPLLRRTAPASRLHALAGWIAVGAIAGSAIVFSADTLWPSGWALVPVLATCTIMLFGPYDGPIGRLLQHPVAVWIGGISYAWYLVHWPLLILPRMASAWMVDLPFWTSLLLVVLSVPVAWCLSRFVENPMRVLPTGRRREWISIGAAACTALLIGGAGFATMRHVATIDFHAAQTIEAFAPTINPTSAAYLGTNLSVRLQDHQRESAIPSGRGCMLTVTSPDPDPGCDYGTNESAVSLALVGDSHAAQWAPAFETLAASGDIQLTTHTRSGCPLYDRSLTGEFNETSLCLNWKHEVISALQDDTPDIIVIAASNRDIPIDAYQVGMQQLLSGLPRDSDLVLLADTPHFPGDPISCLSAYVNDPRSCSIPRGTALDDRFPRTDTQLARKHGARVVDINAYICSAQCHVVQGDTLVYKDSHHLTKTFTAALAGAMAERVLSRGADPAH